MHIYIHVHRKIERERDSHPRDNGLVPRVEEGERPELWDPPEDPFRGYREGVPCRRCALSARRIARRVVSASRIERRIMSA